MNMLGFSKRNRPKAMSMAHAPECLLCKVPLPNRKSKFCRPCQEDNRVAYIQIHYRKI